MSDWRRNRRRRARHPDSVSASNDVDVDFVVDVERKTSGSATTRHLRRRRRSASRRVSTFVEDRLWNEFDVGNVAALTSEAVPFGQHERINLMQKMFLLKLLFFSRNVCRNKVCSVIDQNFGSKIFKQLSD